MGCSASIRKDTECVRHSLFHMEKISDVLVAWYLENKRELPWRQNRDAYRVWVSEIMLQQTRVEAVIPYFERFMKELPTLQDLALCDDDKLNKLWEGLGYYSRVRNMKKAAITCMENYDGKLPHTYQELLSLSGIGSYTAGAIASIAYGQQETAIDGNVMRVYARLFDLHEDILLNSTKKHIDDLIRQDMHEDMGLMNQALMDLGAGICIPNGTARCNICPLNQHCLAYARGSVNALPIRIKKHRKSVHKYTVLIYVCHGKVLIHKREGNGLLAGLYEFVLEEGHHTKKMHPHSQYLGKYTHQFSHKTWEMKGFLIPCEQCFEKEGYKWVSIAEIKNVYSIPSAYRKYVDALLTMYE